MTDPRTPRTIQVWAWPMAMRPDLNQTARNGVRVRIGDAERDQAVAELGDHFAAGRLTRGELDARVDQAMTARFERDLLDRREQILEHAASSDMHFGCHEHARREAQPLRA
jgi:hypothetical protein